MCWRSFNISVCRQEAPTVVACVKISKLFLINTRGWKHKYGHIWFSDQLNVCFRFGRISPALLTGFFFLNQESFVKNNWGLLNWTDFSLFLWLVKQQWLGKAHVSEGREPPNPVGLTLSVLEMRLRMEKGLTQGHTASKMQSWVFCFQSKDPFSTAFISPLLLMASRCGRRQKRKVSPGCLVS